MAKIKKTLLSNEEEQLIIETFNNHEAKDDLSVVVSYEQIKAKNYSFSAGQYFEIKIEHVDITEKQFLQQLATFQNDLDLLFSESKSLEIEIKSRLSSLKYE